MSNKKYTLSFTSGALLHSESLLLVEQYIKLQDWTEVRKRAIEENLLQVRTLSSLKKLSGEIIPRLQKLNEYELHFLHKSNFQDQAYLLWLAVCRHYKFIADFAVEVLRERYITLKADLQYEDFNTFFNHKSDWHPELEKITELTFKKLRQVLFRMLREAGLLTDKNMIQAALLSPALVEIILQGKTNEIQYFPVFEANLIRKNDDR